MTKDDSEDLKAPAGGFKMRRVHPGLTLAETIREHGLTAHALALKLRVPANRITGIVRRPSRHHRRHRAPPRPVFRNDRCILDEPAIVLRSLRSAERDLGEKIAAEVEKAA